MVVKQSQFLNLDAASFDEIVSKVVECLKNGGVVAIPTGEQFEHILLKYYLCYLRLVKFSNLIPQWSELTWHVLNYLCNSWYIISPDTIYGIACLAQHVGGVHSMYRIKGRDEGKPLAICVGDVDQIQRFDSLLSFIRIIPDLLYYVIYWFLILQNLIIILDF